MGALLLAAGYRALTLERLKELVFLTARTTALVCWLFIGSFIFSSVFGYLGGQQVIEQFVLSLDLNPVTFMLLAQVIIFILGWPLEWTEIIVIFVPIFLPLLQLFDIDPLFFGIIVALNLQTSFLSPPVAMAPFYLKGVAPKARADRANLQRRHAVHAHRRLVHGCALHLAGSSALAALRPVRIAGGTSTSGARIQGVAPIPVTWSFVNNPPPGSFRRSSGWEGAVGCRWGEKGELDEGT